jgi:RimJ/RimL family protein N-acetyltransferase
MPEQSRIDAGPASGGPEHILRDGPVFLRPAERDDLPIFVAWLTDARTTRTLALRSPLSQAGEERWFETMVERQGQGQWHFVICRVDDGRPVGAVELRDIDQTNGSAGLGIVIGDPADTGRGYGTAALRAVVAFGMDELRLERIWLDVYAFNDRARRVYERVGFVREGTLRHALFRGGRFHDVDRMAILPEEWHAAKRES